MFNYGILGLTSVRAAVQAIRTCVRKMEGFNSSTLHKGSEPHGSGYPRHPHYTLSP